MINETVKYSSWDLDKPWCVKMWYKGLINDRVSAGSQQFFIFFLTFPALFADFSSLWRQKIPQTKKKKFANECLNFFLTFPGFVPNCFWDVRRIWCNGIWCKEKYNMAMINETVKYLSEDFEKLLGSRIEIERRGERV